MRTAILFRQYQELARDAARHAQCCYGEELSIRVAQPPRQNANQVVEEPRDMNPAVFECGTVERQERDRLAGYNSGGSDIVIDQRHFADDLAWPEQRKRDLDTVGI